MIEFPTLITNALFFVLAMLIVIMPLVDIPCTIFVTHVYLSDTDRPRNRILRILTTSAILVTIVSVFLSALAIQFFINLINGHQDLHADFGGVSFLVALIALECTPVLKARAFLKLDGAINRIASVPEPHKVDKNSAK